MRSAYVAGGTALSIFALLVLVLVIVVCISGLKSCREFFGQSPIRYSPPSSVQIAVVVEGEKSTSDVVMDTEKNPWLDDLINAVRSAAEIQVTDAAARRYIKDRMDCAEDEQVDVSDYIRFKSGSFTPDPVAKYRIDEFVCRVRSQATKWGVFGFASESGKKTDNKKLSGKRACEAIKHSCKQPEFDCKAKDSHITIREMACKNPGVGDPHDFLIEYLGEDHPINGIANSRSVVIAACRAAPGEAETAGKPDTTTLSCPEGG